MIRIIDCKLRERKLLSLAMTKRRKSAAARSITKQLELEFRQHGGKRKGAGRKKTDKSLVNHVKRPKLNGREPINVTQRLVDGLPNIRTPQMMYAFARAVELAKRFGLYVVHYDIQPNHIHLVVEASDKETLSRGMRSLGTSLAIAIKRISGLVGRGKVFKGRYHAHILKTPTEVKRALRYVIFNLAKHKNCSAIVDPYSSVHMLERLEGLVTVQEYARIRKDTGRRPPWHHAISQVVSKASTYLLAIGWRKSRAVVTDNWVK